MLILRRKRHERIVLSLPSRTITVAILAIEGERVKLGVSAPPEVLIVREELLDHPQHPSQDG